MLVGVATGRVINAAANRSAIEYGVMNPNRCETCDHKANPEGGWCYMWKDEPTHVCRQHSAYSKARSERWMADTYSGRMGNEMETENLPVPRIEILQYNGFNGGFARERTLLWKCVIVNASGQREFGGDWMSEGRGTLDKKYAESDAEKWRVRTLWPVFDLGRQPQHDEAPRANA